jgi:hypothetical protein
VDHSQEDYDQADGAGDDKGSGYRANSLTLLGSVAMGTGVMIGAGIFALTGQVAELTGSLYPLTVLFDLGRIASIGAIYYIAMDIALQWGVLRHLRKDVHAKGGIVLTAIALDAVALGAFLYAKATSDPLVIAVALGSMALIFVGEWYFLKRSSAEGA